MLLAEISFPLKMPLLLNKVVAQKSKLTLEFFEDFFNDLPNKQWLRRAGVFSFSSAPSPQSYIINVPVVLSLKISLLLALNNCLMRKT